MPKTKRNPTLFRNISDAGFRHRGQDGWFGIDLPENSTGGLEPNMEGFDKETLPRIRKLLDILG